MADELVKELMEAAGIKQVIVVDDVYAVTEQKMLEVLTNLDASQRASVARMDDSELTDEAPWRDRFSAAWGAASPEAQASMADAAFAFDSDLKPITVGSAEKLQHLFPGVAPSGLSLKEWNEGGRDKAIEKLETVPTLVLFDQDFSQEDQGTETTGQKLIEELEAELNKKEVVDDCYYGILTNTLGPEDEHRRRREITNEASLDPQRFVLISKQHLQGDSTTFAAKLRTTLLAPTLSRLMRSTSTAIAEAQERALEQAHAMAPEDLEDMVVRKPGVAGEWEPDTLVRVLEILQRKKVRRVLREDAKVVGLNKRLRQLASVETGEGGTAIATAQSFSSAVPDAVRLQRQEIYETAEHVNELHLPIGLGDIFAKSGSDKHYILIAQPCDISVRRRGLREPDTTHLILAEIVPNSEKDLFDSFELPYFTETGESRFVKLSRPAIARSLTLDACVLNSDGHARLNRKAEPPDALLPFWLKRHSKMKEEAKKMLRHIEKDASATKEHGFALAGFVAGDPFKPSKVKVDEGLIEWNCQRVRRLTDPHARALLSRFSQYFARDAFLLDLARV